MPFALVLIGLVMIVSGSRDTYKELGAELTDDFTGPNNFTYWVLAFGSVGALGYIPQLRTFSRVFMSLIIIGMLLANQRGSSSSVFNIFGGESPTSSGGGFFENFMRAIQEGPTPTGSSPASEPLSPGFNLGGLLSPNIRFME